MPYTFKVVRKAQTSFYHKSCSLTPNDSFLVKSFYCFLIDRGTKCNVAPHIFKSPCPHKKNTFLCLVWDHKILTIDNFLQEAAISFQLPLASSVIAAFESGTIFSSNVALLPPFWYSFACIIGFQQVWESGSDLWGTWLKDVGATLRTTCSLLFRAIIWQIWFEKNYCIFNSTTLSLFSIFIKNCHLFHAWIDAVPNSKKT